MALFEMCGLSYMLDDTDEEDGIVVSLLFGIFVVNPPIPQPPSGWVRLSKMLTGE